MCMSPGMGASRSGKAPIWMILTITKTLNSRDPVSENSGRYTCSVVNEVGAAMAMSRVTVVSRNSSRTKSYHQVMEVITQLLHFNASSTISLGLDKAM